MKSQSLIPYIVVVALFFSCQSGVDECRKNESTNVTVPVAKEITLTKTGKPGPAYRYIRSIEKGLNLPNIENGTDCIELRIWINYANTDTNQLVRLFKDDKGWRGSLYHFQVAYPNDYSESYFDQLKVDSIQREDIAPRNGWNNFIDKLYAQHIRTLPSYHNLKSYNEATHADYIYFEVSTPNQYREYTYTELRLNKAIPEARAVSGILNTMEKEIGWKPLSKHL